MKVSLINSIDELERIVQEWETLLNNSDVIPIYLNYTWVYNWLKYLGQRHKPYILAVWDAGNLVGLVLLAEKKIGTPFSILRKIEFIGQPGADYLDFIVAGDKRDEIINAVFLFLKQNKKQWDICDLNDFYGLSHTLANLEAYLEKTGWNFRQFDKAECPFLRIEGQWEDFYQKRHNRKFRYNLRRAKKQLEDLGKLEFKKLETVSDLESYLPEIFKIHQLRWKGFYIGSQFSSRRGQKFYTEIAKDYLAKGWLKLAVLLLNNRVIAYSYSFFWNGRYFFYNPAYAPEYSQYSPGTVLLLFLLEDAFNSEMSEFDFGKGELSYKHYWATHSRYNKRIIFANPCLKSKVVFHLYLSFLAMRDYIRNSKKIRAILGKFVQISRWFPKSITVVDKTGGCSF